LPRANSNDLWTFFVSKIRGALLTFEPTKQKKKMKKSILITGASSGIGMASTLLFSKNGYRVFATYRSSKDENKLRAIAGVHPLKMDVTDTAAIDDVFQEISGIVGDDGLYAIINNAGITYTAPFELADEKRARQVMEVNVMAPYKITQAFIPLLKKHNAQNDVKARVVNIASWAGYLGQPFIPFYNASKAALIGLSESMFYDLGLLDIHVVLASPGVTKTPFLEKATDVNMESQAFYKPYLDHYRTMGESARNSKFLATPDGIAKKLYKIVEVKEPNFKYNLAMDAVIVDKIITRLPFCLKAAMNRKMFGLNKAPKLKV
jgi:NAD(P)-dependent dehydrogenase (short-subunit alcohol dehydrogenase family)